MKRSTLPAKIKGRRTVLLKYYPKMAKEIFNCVDRDRAHLGKFLAWAKTPKGVLAYIKYILEDSKSGRSFTYAVFNKKSGVFMGVISALSVRWDNGCCAIGYWISSDFQGQGFMSDAVQALESACFKKGFHRTEIHCDAGNKKSTAVAKRLGYRLDGKLIENVRTGNRYSDTLIFGKVNSKSSRASGRAG